MQTFERFWRLELIVRLIGRIFGGLIIAIRARFLIELQLTTLQHQYVEKETDPPPPSSPRAAKMEQLYRIFNNVKYYYTSLNPTVFSGAIDVIVVEQPDGSYLSTPFHVCFGKWAILTINENSYVDIQINDGTPNDIKMKLADDGVAFFVEEIPEAKVPKIPKPSLTSVLASKYNHSVLPDATSPMERGSPPESRSMSETSLTSETESMREEPGIFTLDENGRTIRYKRTHQLNSDQLKALQLQHGANEARFIVSNLIQGAAWCTCQIYLLKWYERIVISDIDGTITKSDVLGHVIPAIGGSWAHSNIVDLYSRIQLNGYRIIYLSSRAIGQSYQTKRYLESVIQRTKKLPNGPVLLSPASIFMAFRKEVIEKRPEEFKIACLTELRSLFPVGLPFYAGFGNRETDIKSYVAVGMPKERILIIDPTGRVESANRIGFETDYDRMCRDNIVDSLFPPLPRDDLLIKEKLEETRQSVSFKISAFTFWRSEPSEIAPIDDRELDRYEQDRQKRQAEEAKRRKPASKFRFFSG